MFLEQAALEELGESGLRELVGVQVGHLLHETQALDGSGMGDDPADAKTGERDFGEAVDVNDEVRAIELLEGRQTLFVRMQARVDVIFDDGNLVAAGKFQHAATRGDRHGSAGGILEIGREDEKLDAIGGERGFEGFEINAEGTAGFRMGTHRNTEAASMDAVENGGGAGVGGIFDDDGVAGADESFGDEIERLLAAVGDEQRIVFDGETVATEQVEQALPLEGRSHRRRRD